MSDSIDIDAGHDLPVYPKQCSLCRHYARVAHVCDAFPDGIPEPILRGDVDHTRPYSGDHGVQFESRNAMGS